MLDDGRNQISHVLSPLDIRLSCCLLAMFNFNFELLNNLNTFHIVGKDKYLSWWDMRIKDDNKDKQYESIIRKVSSGSYKV